MECALIGLAHSLAHSVCASADRGRSLSVLDRRADLANLGTQFQLRKVGMFRSPIADGVIVLVVLLLFFGPKRLPMLSRSVGESIKEFKGGIDKDKDEITAPTATP